MWKELWESGLWLGVVFIGFFTLLQIFITILWIGSILEEKKINRIKTEMKKKNKKHKWVGKHKANKSLMKGHPKALKRKKKNMTSAEK